MSICAPLGAFASPDREGTEGVSGFSPDPDRRERHWGAPPADECERATRAGTLGNVPPLRTRSGRVPRARSNAFIPS
jgi:hypothetical protein